MELSIILTSWNRSEVLECIDSIWEHTKGHEFELLVTDNGSNLELQEKLVLYREAGAIDILLQKPEGKGQSWAAAMNEAVASSCMPWITVPSLANDFLVTPGWMGAMEAVIHNSLEADYIQWAFAPVLHDGHLQPEGFGGYVLDTGKYAHDQAEDPDYTGHAIISRTLWDMVGPYDEQFQPIYMEDVDWGIRLHKTLSGIENTVEALKYQPAIQLVPESKIIHRKIHTVRGHGDAVWHSNRMKLLAKYPDLAQ